MGVEAQVIQPFEIFFGSQQETGLIETEDRQWLTTKVREEYVRLLNQYGHSDGMAWVVKYAGGKSYLDGPRVKSARKCPPIEIESTSGQLQFRLESSEHEDRPRKLYDPEALDRIFSEDPINFTVEFHTQKLLSPRWLLSFHVFTYDVTYTDHRTIQDSNEHIDYSKVGLPTSPIQLKNLLAFVPVLEEEYQKRQPTVIVKEVSSRLAFPAPIGKLLRLLRKELLTV